MPDSFYPTILIISGSDPSGGAGLQADIKTACAMRVYAMGVPSAFTAQSTRGVVEIRDADTEFLSIQLRTLLDDVRPDAVKIGMLASAENVNCVTDIITHYNLKNIVVDPVLAPTSGMANANDDMIHALISTLFPIASLITPNIPECNRICHMSGMKTIPDDLWGASAILLKGGHECNEDILTDRLFISGSRNQHTFQNQRINSRNTHGTGCFLSTAIASRLAAGDDLITSVEVAESLMQKAILNARDFKFGSGAGPLDWFSLL